MRRIRIPLPARFIIFALIFVGTMWALSKAFAWISSPSDAGVLGGVALLALVVGLWFEFFKLKVTNLIANWIKSEDEDEDEPSSHSS